MENIGKYKILDVLGKGAMGIVYKAFDPDIDREVAIKTIHFEAAFEEGEEEEAIGRFMREARAAGKLNHPNIITIYEVGREADQQLTYIVMQFVKGVSLKKMIVSRRSFTTPEITQLFAQLGDALDYAHSHGIVHRDIKPENILIDEAGRPQIVDFGIARVGKSTMTQTGKTLGTPSYMSPEQVMGKKIDHRSDIFSLGVVLYEILTRKRPFDADNVTTIIYKIINEEPPSLADVKKDVPIGFDQIIQRALSKKPEERYQSCAEMIEDLQNVSRPSEETFIMDVASAPVTAPKRRRSIIWVGAAMCVLIIGISAILIFSPKKAGMVPPLQGEGR